MPLETGGPLCRVLLVSQGLWLERLLAPEAAHGAEWEVVREGGLEVRRFAPLDSEEIGNV